jgi:hypothetical protein
MEWFFLLYLIFTHLFYLVLNYLAVLRVFSYLEKMALVLPAVFSARLSRRLATMVSTTSPSRLPHLLRRSSFSPELAGDYAPPLARLLRRLRHLQVRRTATLCRIPAP